MIDLKMVEKFLEKVSSSLNLNYDDLHNKAIEIAEQKLNESEKNNEKF